MPFDAATLKQPWVKYSLYGVAGLGAIYIAFKYVGGGGGGVVVSQGSIDPGMVALQQQSNALTAASGDANSQRSFALALDAQQSAEKYALVELAGQVSTATQANQIQGTLNLAALQRNASIEKSASEAQMQTNLALINAENVKKQIDSTSLLGQYEIASQFATANLTAATSITNKATDAAVASNLIAARREVDILKSNNDTFAANTISSNQYAYLTNKAGLDAGTARAAGNNAVQNNTTSSVTSLVSSFLSSFF